MSGCTGQGDGSLIDGDGTGESEFRHVYDQSCKDMYDEVVQLEPIGLVLLITDDRWCASNTDENSIESGERTEIRPTDRSPDINGSVL